MAETETSGAALAAAINAGTDAPLLAPVESVVVAPPAPPAAAEPPAPPPVPQIGKLGAKTPTFICVKRSRVDEYADVIAPELRRQFLIPADAAVAKDGRIGDVDCVMFVFPTCPGLIERDALVAFLAKALEAA